MTPLKNYLSVVQQFRTIGELYGMDPLNAVYHPDFRTVIVVLLNLSYIGMSIYTALTYERETAMQAAACLAFSFQGLFKAYTVQVHHQNMYYGHIAILNLYEAFQRTSNVVISENIKRFAVIIRKLSTLYNVVVFSTVLSFAIVAGVMTIVTGIRQPILPAFFPYVDPTELRGYCITICIQVFAMIYGGTGQVAADGVFSITVIHIWPMADMFEECVKDLNESLHKNLEGLSAIQFRNIVLMHREFYE